MQKRSLNYKEVNYKISIDTGFNLSRMVQVYREGEKCPLFGTAFSKSTNDDEIIEWAKRTIDKIEQDKTKTLEQILNNNTYDSN